MLSRLSWSFYLRGSLTDMTMIVAGAAGGMGKASWDSGVPMPVEISIIVLPDPTARISFILTFFKRGLDVVLDRRGVGIELDKRRIDIELKKDE